MINSGGSGTVPAGLSQGETELEYVILVLQRRYWYGYRSRNDNNRSNRPHQSISDPDLSLRSSRGQEINAMVSHAYPLGVSPPGGPAQRRAETQRWPQN